ncbi:MAG: hypothetical protein HYV07_03295 [Deltaproteobacteria bacterium]|nr:hypothetical protein [Deltaproteobacteria bacterium]
MSSEATLEVERRPLVVIGDAFGASPREAARLAAALGVGIEAVFVEDEDLVRVAGLPFASLVRATGSMAPLSRDSFERMIRSARLEAERALLDAAKALSSATFRARIGRFEAVIRLELARADIVVLAARGPRVRSGPVVIVVRGPADLSLEPLIRRSLERGEFVILTDEHGRRTAERLSKLSGTPIQTSSRGLARGVAELRSRLVIIAASGDAVSTSMMIRTELGCPVAIVDGPYEASGS